MNATLPRALGLAALAALLTTPALADRTASRPQVEVVFVLDTTGSMGGLIEAAKQKIWSVVNEIAEGKPSPDIKLGLIGYRDKGDAYVTTRTDLSGDLDAVYEKLMALGADGGGDGPEHVNQALAEAVHKMSWSPSRKTLKVIYLVGDAPPHMDYQDDQKYPAIALQAVRKDLIINTIQCGSWDETRVSFTDIAHRSEGTFMAIAQDGGAVAVATPYDGRLAELAGKMDSTYLTYGRAEEQAARKAKLVRSAEATVAAAPAAAADRATFKGSAGGGFFGGRDLIADAETGTVSLDKLGDDELPMELRGKDKATQATLIAQKKTERAQIQKEIAALSKQRDEHIKNEMAKKGGAKDGFDAKVVESLRAKAATKGITY
ncbi:MAG: vWA domain-containing protein [Pseudomonadota bacterium]